MDAKVDDALEAERPAQQALARAAAVREQLELAEHDKRALAAQVERLEAAERAARLNAASVDKLREADRKEHLKLRAQLVEVRAELRAAQLTVDTLGTSLSSAEAEIKWFSSELEKRSASLRQKAAHHATQMGELENLLQVQRTENDALKQRLTESLTREKRAVEQLERAKQERIKEPPAPAADMSWQDLTLLEAELQMSRMQQDTSNKRHSDMAAAYAEVLEREAALAKRVSEAEQALVKSQDALSSKASECDATAAVTGRLGRLLRYILINTQLAADGLPLLTAQEKADLDAALRAPLGVSNTMQVLEDRLVYFVDVCELVDMNQKQLRVLDTLAAKCEKYEAGEQEESETVKAATEHIERLARANEGLEEQIGVLREQVAEAEARADEARANAKESTEPVTKPVEPVTQPAAQPNPQQTQLQTQLEAAQERCASLRSSELLLRTQKEAIDSQLQAQQRELVKASARAELALQENDALRAQLRDKDDVLNASQRQSLGEIESLRTQVTLHRHENQELQQQARLGIQQLEAGRRENETTKAQLVEARHTSEKLQLRLEALQRQVEEGAERLRLRTISFTTADTERVHALEQELEQAQGQIKDLRALAAENQRQLEAKDGAIKDAERRHAEAEEKLTAANAAYETLKNTPPDTTELDEARAQVASLTASLSDANQSLDATKKEAASKAAEMAKSLEDATASAQSHATTLAEQIKQLQADLTAATANSAQQAAAAAEVDKLNASNKVLDELVAKLRVENTQLSAKNELLAKDPETSEVTEMLKRDKHEAVLKMEEALDKVKMLELRVRALQEAAGEPEPSKDAKDGEPEPSKNCESSASTLTQLLESNEFLGNEITQLSQQLETTKQELVVAQSSLDSLQSSLRDAESARDGLQAQLDLTVKDRDVWKQHSQGSSELTSLQEQLTAASAKADNLAGELAQKQKEFDAALQSASERDATNQKRITHLENEINRISDDFTEEEQKARKLEEDARKFEQEARKFEQEVSRLEQEARKLEQLKEKAPELPAELPDAPADAPTTAELEQLLKEFSESDAPKAEKLRELTTNEVKNRLRQKTQAVIASRIAQATEEERAKALKQISDEKASVEAMVKKQFELKSKMMQKKIENLASTNEELKMTVRKLKGGEQAEVVTMPDGTTKAVPKGPSLPSAPSAQNTGSAGNAGNAGNAGRRQKPQPQRPAINRNGKRKNDNDDALTKRMRDN